jgi:hypothetical protein
MRYQFIPDVFALCWVRQSSENLTFLRDQTGQVIVFTQGFGAYPCFTP